MGNSDRNHRSSPEAVEEESANEVDSQPNSTGTSATKSNVSPDGKSSEQKGKGEEGKSCVSQITWTQWILHAVVLLCAIGAVVGGFLYKPKSLSVSPIPDPGINWFALPMKIGYAMMLTGLGFLYIRYRCFSDDDTIKWIPEPIRQTVCRPRPRPKCPWTGNLMIIVSAIVGLACLYCSIS